MGRHVPWRRGQLRTLGSLHPARPQRSPRPLRPVRAVRQARARPHDLLGRHDDGDHLARGDTVLHDFAAGRQGQGRALPAADDHALRRGRTGPQPASRQGQLRPARVHGGRFGGKRRPGLVDGRRHQRVAPLPRGLRRARALEAVPGRQGGTGAHHDRDGRRSRRARTRSLPCSPLLPDSSPLPWRWASCSSGRRGCSGSLLSCSCWEAWPR